MWNCAQQILSYLEDIWIMSEVYSAFQKQTARKEFGKFYALLHAQVGINGVIPHTEGLLQYV